MVAIYFNVKFTIYRFKYKKIWYHNYIRCFENYLRKEKIKLLVLKYMKMINSKNNKLKIYSLIFLVFTSITFISCNDSQKNSAKPMYKPPTGYSEEDEKFDPKVEPVLSKEEEEELYINKLIDSMTLEEKVSQLFMLDFRKDLEGNCILEVNDTIREFMKSYKIGGIILFSENIDNPDQTKQLINEFNSMSSLPLIVGVDEEGRLVNRVNRKSSMNLTPLPNAIDIGKTNDAKKAYKTGNYIGSYLNDLGFNLDFAPVADVNTNPNNPVIGIRSFGSEPELVSRMVLEFSKGLQDANVVPVIKHFPGHGDTGLDSHNGSVQVMKTWEELKSIEWVPFKKAIDNGIEVIMIGHIETPLISDTGLPSSLNSDIIQKALREELGFNGVVITDALEMGAIANYYNSSEAAIMAIDAGVDILLMPSNFIDAYDGILSAIKEGKISESRINESLYRILKLKVKNSMIDVNS